MRFDLPQAHVGTPQALAPALGIQLHVRVHLIIPRGKRKRGLGSESEAAILAAVHSLQAEQQGSQRATRVKDLSLSGREDVQEALDEVGRHRREELSPLHH